jgi:hypothetical protein
MVFIVLALVRFMVADRASDGCAYNAVVTRDVARRAAHYCTFDAAFGVRRINGCQADRYCYARTCNKCFHFGLRSLARFNKPTRTSPVPLLAHVERLMMELN